MTGKLTCAHCGGRDATSMFGGKPSCDECPKAVADVGLPYEEKIRHRIARALKHQPDSTASDIAERLSIVYAKRHEDVEMSREYDIFIHALSRLVKKGFVEARGSSPGKTYSLVKDVPLPRYVTGEKRRRKRPSRIRNAEEAALFRQYMKDRKARLKADRRCVDCGSGLEEGRTQVKCPECHERNLEFSKNYRKTERGRVLDRAQKKRAYQSNVEAARAERKERYMRKKLSGVCQSCSTPAEEDSQYCAAHRQAANEACREYRRRLRAA